MLYTGWIIINEMLYTGWIIINEMLYTGWIINKWTVVYRVNNK